MSYQSPKIQPDFSPRYFFKKFRCPSPVYINIVYINPLSYRMNRILTQNRRHRRTAIPSYNSRHPLHYLAVQSWRSDNRPKTVRVIQYINKARTNNFTLCIYHSFCLHIIGQFFNGINLIALNSDIGLYSSRFGAINHQTIFYY